MQAGKAKVSLHICTSFSGQTFFCGSFLLFLFRVSHTFLSVHCSLMVTCWERADLLALLCEMFFCVFVTFPYDVLGTVVLDCIDT